MLIAAFAAFAVVVAMWWASPAAHAHDALVASEPADGASLDAAPAAATLTFSGEISPVGIGFALHDAAGTTLDLPTVAQPDGTVVTQQLPALGAGGYALDWRVVSSDGHPISGTISFTVTEAAGAAGASGTDGAPVATIGGSAQATNDPDVPAVNMPATPTDTDVAPTPGLPVWAIVLIGIAGVGVIVGALLGFRAAAKRNDEWRERAQQRDPDADE